MFIPSELFVRKTPDMTFLAAQIESKMDRYNDEAEMYRGITGAVFVMLPLSGDVTLRREIFANGSHGPTSVRYQTGDSSMRWYDHLEVRSGDVFYRFRGAPGGHSEKGLRLSGLRRGVLLAKVMKGRPDHWDRESDFYGNEEIADN